MSDVQKVRFPCEEHGVWFRHMVKGSNYKWCDGGETKLLRVVKVGLGGFWESPDEVWVEVTDD